MALEYQYKFKVWLRWGVWDERGLQTCLEAKIYGKQTVCTYSARLFDKAWEKLMQTKGGKLKPHP